MAAQMPTTELPSGVEIARFMRITVNIGFMGGQEKTVEYDEYHTTSDGEKKYRQFSERHSDHPAEGAEDGDFDLKEVTKRRTVTTVHNQGDVSYTEHVKNEELFLVTWDHASSIHVMSPDEAMQVLDAVVAQEGKLRASDLPSDSPELFSDSSSRSTAPPTQNTTDSDSGEPVTSDDNGDRRKNEPPVA